MEVSDDRVFNMLSDLTKTTGKIEGTLTQFGKQLDRVEKIHQKCPARAAYTAGKNADNTGSIDISSASNMIEKVKRSIWPLVAGLLVGAAAVGFLLSKSIFGD